MKSFILLVLLAAGGWYGYLYLEERDLAVADLPGHLVGLLDATDLQGVMGNSSAPLEKCTTAAGEVIYGEVPADVQCAKVETVDGSLTVVPREVIVSIGQSVDGADAADSGEQSAGGDNDEVERVVNCASRQRCTQMQSCDEARLLIGSCGNLRLDDMDDRACIRYWCDRD